MADSYSQIHKGDEVEWNWGTSHPNGVVAEIQEEGKLEIKTKGKLIHKNASAENPAVHVAREGNDVVKRMSELTKIGSGDGEDVSGGEEGGHQGARDEEGEEFDKGDEGQNEEKQSAKKQLEVDNPAEKNAEYSGEKGDIGQGKTEVAVGEKRKRQEPGDEEEGKPTEDKKKSNGGGKKAKVSGEAETASSPKKGRQMKAADKSKGKNSNATVGAAKRARTTRASATTEGDGNELMELGDEEKEVPQARN